MKKKTILQTLILAPCLMSAMGSVFAQVWPVRPIKVIAPISPVSSPNGSTRIKSGKLSGNLKQAVPTVKEVLGVHDFNYCKWVALSGPANVPKSAVSRLHEVVTQMMARPGMRCLLMSMGLEPADDRSLKAMSQLMKSFAKSRAELIDSATSNWTAMVHFKFTRSNML